MICPICENKDELVETYTYPDGETTLLACPGCAAEAGFCMVCGAFIAGSELDEHSMMIGVCYDCVLELKAEIGESDEDHGSEM